MEEVSPFLCPPEEKKNPKWDEIEGGLSITAKPEAQVSSIRKLIQYQVSGEQPPESALMGVITNLSASRSHEVKKLLYLFYEICDTRDRKGQLKPEFHLICDGIIKDLTHPNEYIRATALRFLSRFNEPELIKNVVPFVSKSFEHKNAYVRRHAVVAIGRIHQRWPEIAPDAPEEIADLLKEEQDPACKRVAFLVLCDISRDLAATFLDEILDDSVLKLSQPMQLTAVTLIKSLCTQARKGSYLPALIELLDSPSPAVKIEASITLLTLSTSATASQASFSTLCQIMQTIPNAALQLSLAEQIERLIPSHPTVAQQMVGELIVAMKAKPIRKTVLKMIKKLAGPSNINVITQQLLSHITTQQTLRQNENESAAASEFIKDILSTFRSISATYPAVLAQIYDTCRQLLLDNSREISFEAIMIIREYAMVDPSQQNKICLHLENILSLIPNVRNVRSATYLISLYTKRPDSIDAIIDAFFHREEDCATPETAKNTTTTIIGKDGTYITVDNSNQEELSKQDKDIQDMRKSWFERGANIFVAATMANAMARICIRFPDTANKEKCLGFVESILMRPQASAHQKRLLLAHAAIAHCKESDYTKAFVDDADEAFKEFIETSRKANEEKQPAHNTQHFIAPDQRLSFASLLGRRFDQGIAVKKQADNDEEVQEKKMTVLTGTCDPVFCECTMKPGKFDIGMDIRLLNQTQYNFHNVHVEFYCSGKLEIVDKPAVIELPAFASDIIHATVKATSAEAGRVFGNILYDIEGSTDRQLMPISPITVTPQTYMNPTKLDQPDYRTKWYAFEWEKKMSIKSSTRIPDYIRKLAEIGKFALMNEFDEDCTFTTVNLCSSSMFNEFVLLNVSLEINDEGQTVGYMRLRCETQSMALSYSRMLMALNI